METVQIVQVLIASYITSLALVITTHGPWGGLVFKVIPFFSGLALFAIVFKLI